MNFIKKIWNGELPLVKVYWLYGVAVGLVLIIFSLLIKDYPTALILLTFALIPYQILVFVGIWRSANAYTNKKVWAVLAKVHVVLGVIAALNGVATVVKGFSFDSSHTLSNCVQCEDGKCEPSTSWKSVKVRLLPNENRMKVSIELWNKDENGNYEIVDEILLDRSIIEFEAKCAIKSDTDGFCSYEYTPSKFKNFTQYNKETFIFDGKNYSHTYNYHIIFDNNEEHKWTSEYSCSSN